MFFFASKTGDWEIATPLFYTIRIGLPIFQPENVLYLAVQPNEPDSDAKQRKLNNTYQHPALNQEVEPEKRAPKRSSDWRKDWRKTRRRIVDACLILFPEQKKCLTKVFIVKFYLGKLRVHPGAPRQYSNTNACALRFVRERERERVLPKPTRHPAAALRSWRGAIMQYTGRRWSASAEPPAGDRWCKCWTTDAVCFGRWSQSSADGPGLWVQHLWVLKIHSLYFCLCATTVITVVCLSVFPCW